MFTNLEAPDLITVAPPQRLKKVLQDLRFFLREFRKKPGLALTAIISLALGIGATTAVFSVIYGLLANPFPYKGADRMINLAVVNESGDDWWVGVTGPQLKLLGQARCLESVAASWGTWNLTTTDEELPQDVPSVQLSGNAGSHFGVPALLGRTLIPSDAPEGRDPEPVVVLSYLFWQRHFNSDRSVIGRRLQLVHKNYTIVGVLPSRFTWNDADIYLPLKITNDPSITLGPLIRLKPGVTRAAADAELQPLIEQFAKEDPSHFPKKFRVRVKGINDRYVEHLGQSLFLLFGAVGLLLLIGCANVSILLLARGTARQHELAVRTAIGASRGRIYRQLLTEALALSLLGALAGVALAYRLLPLLMRWLPEFSFPHEVVISISSSVESVGGLNVRWHDKCLIGMEFPQRRAAVIVLHFHPDFECGPDGCAPSILRGCHGHVTLLPSVPGRALDQNHHQPKPTKTNLNQNQTKTN